MLYSNYLQDFYANIQYAIYYAIWPKSGQSNTKKVML